MEKRSIVVVIALLLVPCATQAGLILVHSEFINKFKEEMKVGDEQKVTAVFMEIVSGNDIVELMEKKPGQWIVKAMRPGKARVGIKKRKAGHSVKRHECFHDIMVYPKGQKQVGKKNKLDDAADMAEMDIADEAQIRKSERKMEAKHRMMNQNKQCKEKKCKKNKNNQ